MILDVVPGAIKALKRYKEANTETEFSIAAQEMASSIEALLLEISHREPLVADMIDSGLSTDDESWESIEVQVMDGEVDDEEWGEIEARAMDGNVH